MLRIQVRLPTGRARGERPRRRTLSLRARLLAGLIALTTTFLVVLGVVTTVVLGTLDHNQLNAEVKLASRQSVLGMAAGSDGFAAAYASLSSAKSGTLTASSPAAAALLTVVRGLAGLSWQQASARLGLLARSGQPFNVTVSGSPTVRAAWRMVGSGGTASARGLLPPGRELLGLLPARDDSGPSLTAATVAAC